jgi:cytochrome P450
MMEYDPLSAESLTDPYPIYAELRNSAPVFWHDRLESWVLTTYADCWSVLRDTKRFANDWRRAGFEIAGMENASLQALDPPEHTPIRHLFINALREQDLAGIGAMAAAEAREAFKLLSDRSHVDYTADVARPVALRAMSRMLGVETPVLDSFVSLADAIERGMDAGLVPEAAEPAAIARREFDKLVETWASHNGQAGLLRSVLRDRANVGVPVGMVWSTARVMFLAGFSTTVSAASSMVLALLSHPSALTQLREGAFSLDHAVEELLRYDSPIQGTSRVAVETVEIGGRTIERGHCVLPLIGAANRDPGQFADPDELRLGRTPNRHLSFGWGPHACTGALLARVLLRALLESLLELRNPAIAGEVGRAARATVRYPDRLPIAFEAP